MCHYITLIVPTDDIAAVQSVMLRHGRDAYRVNNASLRGHILDEDRQYLTTKQHCDCGTVLGRRAEPIDEHQVAARLRRKKWSEARVRRGIEDQRKRNERPHSGPDSIELWQNVLVDLKTDLHLPRAALFVHSYSGDLEDDLLTATRRKVDRDLPLSEALAQLNEDEVTVFSLV